MAILFYSIGRGVLFAGLRVCCLPHVSQYEFKEIGENAWLLDLVIGYGPRDGECRLKAILSMGLLVAWGVQAQTGAEPARFEVASIKRSGPDVRGFTLQMPPGGISARGITLKNLISLAYGVREVQILGGPGWVDSDRFDIDARVERPSASNPAAGDSAQLTNEQQRQNGSMIRECLKSLLAERFRLAVHDETKEQNVYALVVAKNGPKFHQATAESGASIRGQKGSISGRGTTMQALAVNLTGVVGRTVLDHTGLSGRFDFDLKWNPDGDHASGSSGGGAGEVSYASDPDDPSVDASLQEQLGLRLEPDKSSVKVLLIDHLEKPLDN